MNNTGGLFADMSPERQRQYEADQARLEAKRALVSEIIDRAFREELNEQFESDHVAAETEAHQIEIEKFRTFCRNEGLPETFPSHPLDVCAWLLECASNSAEAALRAHGALVREHLRRMSLPNPMIAPAVRVVVRALTSKEPRKGLH